MIYREVDRQKKLLRTIPAQAAGEERRREE